MPSAYFLVHFCVLACLFLCLFCPLLFVFQSIHLIFQKHSCGFYDHQKRSTGTWRSQNKSVSVFLSLHKIICVSARQATYDNLIAFTVTCLFLSYLSRSLADRWGTTVDFTTSFLHSSRFSAFRSMIVQYDTYLIHLKCPFECLAALYRSRNKGCWRELVCVRARARAIERERMRERERERERERGGVGRKWGREGDRVTCFVVIHLLWIF